MWSIYDTCILLSGVITSVIAVLPLRGIPIRTRAIAGLVGGGLIVVSLVLGKLSAFRYPAIVLIGPLIALSALGAVVWDERRDRGKDAGRQYDETASGLILRPLILSWQRRRSRMGTWRPAPRNLE